MDKFQRAKAKAGLKVAAYIRVSTDSSDQENSFKTQERYFNQLLAEHASWISAGIYSDQGLSGTNEEGRTGFRRILRHCREGKIDHIVCKSISRFARNTSDFIAAMRTLRDCRVTIRFEREALDTAEPTSDFLLTTLGAIAQEESRSISGNIRWGMQKRFSKGDVRNQALYGYRYNGKIVTTDSGYRYRDIEIVEWEAEVVRWIFQAVADGMAFNGIARELNGKRIPAPESFYVRKRKEHSAKGQLNSDLEEGWTARHISQMVRLERYVGDVLVQKTYTPDYLSHKAKTNKGEAAQYLVKDHHPAIIDRKLYEEVQKIIGMNANRYGGRWKNRKMRAFSGRLICAECGRYFHVRNTQSNPIWFCPSANLNNGKSICHSETVCEGQIARMFCKAIAERFGMAAMPVRDDVRVHDVRAHGVKVRNGTAHGVTACDVTAHGVTVCDVTAHGVTACDGAAHGVTACDGTAHGMTAADAKVDDIMSGRFSDGGSSECAFSSEAADFVTQMLARLEEVQRLDYMERDRSFLKRQIFAASQTIERMRKRICLLTGRKESLEARKHALGDESISDKMIAEIDARLEEEKRRLTEEEAEEQKLIGRMNDLESYWEELEENFDRREKAMEWMRKLPKGQAGVAAFLKGMIDEHAKAFVLSVTVHSPLAYRLHWFDDVWTAVDLHGDIEDFCHGAAYF